MLKGNRPDLIFYPIVVDRHLSVIHKARESVLAPRSVIERLGKRSRCNLANSLSFIRVQVLDPAFDLVAVSDVLQP